MYYIGSYYTFTTLGGTIHVLRWGVLYMYNVGEVLYTYYDMGYYTCTMMGRYYTCTIVGGTIHVL